jgi:hypothetical protein
LAAPTMAISELAVPTNRAIMVGGSYGVLPKAISELASLAIYG